MSKRVALIGLVAGVGLATLGTGTAEAQWSFLQPPGMWWYWGSVDGCASITKVPNPTTNPALLRCDIQLTRIETLCYNPNNHDVTPGVAGARVLVSSAIKPSDITDKKKGKADVCVGVDELSLGAETLCVNRNWIPKLALTQEFVATCTTEKCTGTDPLNPCATTVVKDTKRCACTLPSGYSFDNMPTPCSDPKGIGCVPYDCVELDIFGNPTANSCQLQ